MDYRYHIRQFSWNKELNEFFAEAYFLECVLPGGEFHPEAFPNQKQQFYIDNPKTGGFRRFRFIKEENVNVEMDDESWFYTYWMFESEDGIKCKILIN